MQEHNFPKGTLTIDGKDTPANEATRYSDDFYHYMQAVSSWCEDGKGIGFTLSGCMRKEDAQLIAAAPDLFNALKSLVEFSTLGVTLSKTHPFYIAAENALNKALGKTQL